MKIRDLLLKQATVASVGFTAVNTAAQEFHVDARWLRTLLYAVATAAPVVYGFLADEGGIKGVFQTLWIGKKKRAAKGKRSPRARAEDPQ